MTKRVIHTLMLISALAVSEFAYGQKGNTAPCHEVQEVTIANDAVKRKILSDFIKKSVQEETFSSLYDKGILHLYEYHNSKNNLCWVLYARIDDYYKDNPPARFSDFKGDIVLVYDADSTGRPRKNEGDIKSINDCLEKIIGDRVFTRPTIRTRWTSEVMPFTNRKRSEGNRRMYTGGGGGISIEFYKDNTYTISPMM